MTQTHILTEFLYVILEIDTLHSQLRFPFVQFVRITHRDIPYIHCLVGCKAPWC